MDADVTALTLVVVGWIQQVTATTVAVTCWIQQPTCVLPSTCTGGQAPPVQIERKMNVGGWVQQVTAIVDAVTCWTELLTTIICAVTFCIQQPVQRWLQQRMYSDIDESMSKLLQRVYGHLFRKPGGDPAPLQLRQPAAAIASCPSRTPQTGSKP